jgi:hypothetical protein
MDGGHGRTLWFIGRGHQQDLVGTEDYMLGFNTDERAAAGLHYPYVLAFEPTFVEIRHVETGLMKQVIQGNNLRLLFADTPPSTTNSASTIHQHQSGYGYPRYGAPSQVSANYAGGRQGPYAAAGYGQPPPNHHHLHQPNPRMSQPACRDEILMVSDDRVVTLRITTDPHQHTSIPR